MDLGLLDSNLPQTTGSKDQIDMAQERGKSISVQVEQAFPTCILVSYQDGDKTFRGVLLHETTRTVTRASISKAITNEDNSSNLCLTSARAVTCEEQHASRVSTRSSSMMSQDQGDAPIITPVHKIRGLVQTLSPRKRRAKEDSATETPFKQRPSLMKSLKRKRTNSATSSKPIEENTNEIKDDLKIPQKLSLFPVLKLRRRAGTINNYVTVPVDADKNEQCEVKTKERHGNSHRHNTRFKGQTSSDQVQTERKTSESLSNGESLVEVYTKTTLTEPSVDAKPRDAKNARRGLHPRNHNQELKVGDVVWGKVHGHPWWPGRILGILCHASESEAGFVKVAWYGSTTTSEISCSFLMTFQENFKHLFKKQKTGAYRRAVREAQQDLQV